jgi:hypothetical protein
MTKTRRDEHESNHAPSAPQSVGDTRAAETERERVAQRAYELYLERGRGDGQAMEDWLSAERELVGGRSSTGR